MIVGWEIKVAEVIPDVLLTSSRHSEKYGNIIFFFLPYFSVGSMVRFPGNWSNCPREGAWIRFGLAFEDCTLQEKFPSDVTEAGGRPPVATYT